VKVSRFRKPMAVCFLSNVEYRHNTNSAILYTHRNIYRTRIENGTIRRISKEEEKKERK
jgi:hypothetical protein